MRRICPRSSASAELGAVLEVPSWPTAASPGRRSGSGPCRRAWPRTWRCRHRAAGLVVLMPGAGDGDTDAGQHGHVVAGDRDRLAEQAVEQPLGRRRSRDRCHRVLEQDRELVAAETGRRVAGAGTLRMRSATIFSSWSPTAWPSASLTDLKSSRSTNNTTTGSLSGRATRSAWSMRSRNSARLASPVSSSWNARWLSWRSRLRCSVTSRNVATIPSTASPPSRLAIVASIRRCSPSTRTRLTSNFTVLPCPSCSKRWSSRSDAS